MFKKIISFSLITIFLLSYCSISWADDEIDDVEIADLDKVIETATQASQAPKLDSRYAVVLDRQTKAILYGKNEMAKTKMASTTKIMTSLVVIEKTNLNNIVEVSKKAAGTGGSRLKIKAGDKIRVKDLLYGLMLQSGNDAAVALAEYVGGSIEGFANLMNQKAKEIGLVNTHFSTPHGLDKEDHYTTAYELALLADYALHNETFAKIVNTKSCTININGYTRNIHNTNELLGNLNGVYGVKTGFTNGAGRCLVTATKRGNLDIICVVLGADTKKIRTADSVKLIEYSFGNYEKVNIKELLEEEFNNWKAINEGRIVIKKGKKQKIAIKLGETSLGYYPILKGTQDKISIQIEANLDLIAPIEANVKIGEVTIYYDNHIIQKIGIFTNETVEKKDVQSYLIEILKNYGSYLEMVIHNKS